MKKLAAAAALISGIICGLLFFLPWDTAAVTAADTAAARAAEKGVYITVSSAAAEGFIPKSFRYRDVTADLPMLRITLSEALIRPMMTASLLSRGLKCGVETGRGSIVTLTRQPMEWRSGSAMITLSDGTVKLDDIAFVGSTSLSGSAELSSSDGSLVKASLLLKSEPEIDRALEMAKNMGMLRLTKVKPGEWRIEK
ncbi:MAG: hypothetical protein IJM42_04005 [Synergistes sp.]|nr:hypothetical protein [Synergistes sp.]